MEVAIFALGLIILLLNFADFLYTTLSGNGSGMMTNFINRNFAGVLFRLLGSKVKSWSGLLHLILCFSNWILWLMLGSFLLFLSHSEMVINATTSLPADPVERFYFTGFVLSTLGVGDYIPGTHLARIIVVLMAIGGFMMLTTALTYLISVTGAVTKKKNLATFISRMGSNPLKLYEYVTTTPDLKLLLNSQNELLTQMDDHANDHLSFPIIHHFLTGNRHRSAAVQLTSLNEVLTVLINECQDEVILARLQRIRRSLKNFLNVAEINAKPLSNHEDVNSMRQQAFTGHGIDISKIEWSHERSERFTQYLSSAGWSWSDVYQQNEE